ncbi:MAG: type II secretion system GspH family protein [Candidatus Omnitrophica bacterium]|nr:type II secretion system GspH family protein [Candidatus Omnitrophota bacterium]
MAKKIQGFTLIELMISIGIFGIVFLALLSGYMSCLKINESSRGMMIATEDARRVIEQMRSLAVASLVSITAVNWTSWASANGLTALPAEQIVVTYTDGDGTGNPLDDDPLQVTVRVNWNEAGRARALNLATRITVR